MTIRIIVILQSVLHLVDFFFDKTHFVSQFASVSVDPVKLLEHQIQTFLERGVILLQLVQVLIRGVLDGA